LGGEEMGQTETNTREQEKKHIEGKFLTFVLWNEEYGLEILKVREIIGLLDITPVPQTPDFVKGVINLRGKVIPVVDLRLKFGMPPADYTKETCIIVVDVESLLMGIIVDTVSEVLDIKEGDIEPPPSFGQKVDVNFILGMGKIKKKVEILLNIDKVLSGRELRIVEQMVE
jgi:purine-binding chemotaxis protein CheW